MVVLRSSQSRSAGISSTAVYPGVDGDAALVLFRSCARRATRARAQDRGGDAEGTAGPYRVVRGLGRNDGRPAEDAGGVEAGRDAILAGLRGTVCIFGGCGDGRVDSEDGRRGGDVGE